MITNNLVMYWCVVQAVMKKLLIAWTCYMLVEFLNTRPGWPGVARPAEQGEGWIGGSHLVPSCACQEGPRYSQPAGKPKSSMKTKEQSENWGAEWKLWRRGKHMRCRQRSRRKLRSSRGKLRSRGKHRRSRGKRRSRMKTWNACSRILAC